MRLRRKSHLDALVAAERDRVGDAEAEEKKSLRRLEAIRTQVVGPLRAAGKRNQFAAMIADSLREERPR